MEARLLSENPAFHEAVVANEIEILNAMLNVEPWDSDKALALVLAYQQLTKVVRSLHNSVMTGEMAAAELSQKQ